MITMHAARSGVSTSLALVASETVRRTPRSTAARVRNRRRTTGLSALPTPRNDRQPAASSGLARRNSHAPTRCAATRRRVNCREIVGWAPSRRRFAHRSALWVHCRGDGEAAAMSTRLAVSSTFWVNRLPRCGAARNRRPTAAIIAGRSGFLAERFAGPARAFFMRRFRPRPDGFPLSVPRFKRRLTLGPCHAASP
jgi:hypothetical protein